MGRVRNNRQRTSKNKQFKKSHDTKRRARDIDQIQDELRKVQETGVDLKFEPDEDLPGMGQFYCSQCARHFGNQVALAAHLITKVHKRRLKDLAQEQYTQAEADRGAGMTKEVLPPAHPRNNEGTMA
jgi:hypothetical protein